MLDIRDAAALRQATLALMALAIFPSGGKLGPGPAAAQTAPTFTYLTPAAPAKTTRYWDCCKGSCASSGKAAVTAPVGACAKDGETRVGATIQSACSGGSAYTCNANQPWSVSTTLSYGFAAAGLVGSTEAQTSCACYALQFTSGPISAKTMVVQVVNVVPDGGSSHFDLLIPGGGVGIQNGCSSQWGAPSSGWGAQYGGISSQSQCGQLPAKLQPGCTWRFSWLQNVDNPSVSYRRVKCPADLTAKTGCKRTDE